MTIDNGQLTIIGATDVVHLYPSVKVCRERPVCRSGNVTNTTCMVILTDVSVGAAICRPLRFGY